MERGKVVVIDDSPLVRRLAELALEEEGYKVYTAEDGEDGLKTAEEVLPSVILVDFIMPRMSGYQFCKLARESQILKDVPIILITGKGEDVGKKFIEKFGITDFFIKPFKSETLVEKVASIVDSREPWTQEEGAAVAVAAEPYMAEAGEAEAVTLAGLGEAVSEEAPYRIEIEELREEAAAVAAEPYMAEAGEAEALSPAGRGGLAVSPSVLEPLVTRGALPAPGSDVPDHASIRWDLRNELPFLLQRSVSDVLTMHGVVRSPHVAVSGDLSQVDISDIFRLIETGRMTGRLLLHAPRLWCEIHVEEGRIAGAMLSKPSAPRSAGDVMPQGLPESVTREALSAALMLGRGSFLFESLPPSCIPPSVHERMDIGAAIADIMRGFGEEIAGARYRDVETVFVRVIAEDGLAALRLSDDEAKIASLVDGRRTLAEVAAESGLKDGAVKKILWVLTRAGAVREK